MTAPIPDISAWSENSLPMPSYYGRKSIPGGKIAVLRTMWRDRISWNELVDEMDRAMQIPGNTNAWTMPIRGRIDMLSTGVRTPVGIKVLGSNDQSLESLGKDVENVLQDIPGTRSAFAERAAVGHSVDFTPDRDALARYGLTVEDVQLVLLAAVGGQFRPRSRNVSVTRSPSVTRGISAPTKTSWNASW